MHPRDRTGKAVDGLQRAEAGYVCEHPIQDTNLCETRYQGSNHLYREEEFRRDFHVVTEFQVGGEFDALRGADVAVCHENHIGYRSSGEDDAADELADEVQAAVLIGDGHDNANGDEQHGGDAQG